MMPPFLKGRKQYRAGLRNIRTLPQAGKLVQVSKEMDNYSINTRGFSEYRWAGNGKLIVRSESSVLLLSRTEQVEQEGVSPLLDKITNKCLIDYEAINGRTLRARFLTTYFKLTLILTYTPTD